MLRKTWVNRFTRQLKPDPWQVRQEAQDRSQKNGIRTRDSF